MNTLTYVTVNRTQGAKNRLISHTITPEGIKVVCNVNKAMTEEANESWLTPGVVVRVVGIITFLLMAIAVWVRTK